VLTLQDMLTRAVAALPLLALVALGCGGEEDNPKSPTPQSPLQLTQTGSVAGPAQALAPTADRLYVAGADGLEVSQDDGASWAPLTAVGLPAGHVNVLLALPGESDVLVAYVWGKGLFRSEDGGESFVPLDPLLTYDILASFVTPRATVVPFGGDVDPTDPTRAVLAGPGGFYRSRDAGQTWELLEPSPVPGQLLLFWLDADVRGDTLVGAVQAPSNLLPPGVGGLVGRGVVISQDDGATWEDITGDPSDGGLTALALTGISLADDGTVFVASMDGGLFRHDGDGKWSALGGPGDAVTVATHGGGATVGSGTRGMWRWQPSGWSQLGVGPAIAAEDDHALGYDGSVYGLADGFGDEPPAAAGGTVHLAISFHVNLYHSFRGDSNDEEGYGQDITIIRNSLDWLDEFPEVHADWDMENAFSTDDWLAVDAPDILERVAARVAAGKDDNRIMSWNNGAVSAQTFEEFEQSIERAKVSLTAAFGEFVPGVQPQENMFSPDHVGWYRQLGIEWITMFNSMNPFTAFPLDVQLEGRELYAPITLQDGDDAMTLVPVYQHGDVFDHGGLRAWINQIADNHSGDTLLVIHFDADSETWLNFDGELADIADLDNVVYTNIQTYLDEHEDIAAITLEGDQSDGIGDGYQSWAEKDINHEIYSQVARSRAQVDWARAIAPMEPAVLTAAEDSLTQRLLTLSTTNFGLSSPYLHPDREITARAFAQQSVDDASAALAAAEATAPVAPGTLELVNTRGAAGPTLVSMTVEVPAAAYVDLSPLAVFDGGDEVPVVVEADAAADPVVLRATGVVNLPANGTKILTWSYDPTNPALALGAATASDVDPASLPLLTPFTECLDRGKSEAIIDDAGSASVDPRSVRATLTRQHSLALCDGMGSLSHTFSVYDGLPGTVLAVDALIGDPSDDMLAESVALTPLGCEGDVAEIEWLTFGGVQRTRPARRGQETWNGQAADGWVAYLCEDGASIQIAHRVRERTSLAFSPMRNDDGQALFAPLGTLWGDTPWHFGRRIGGHGAGDMVGILTPQFNPTAPDWSGKAVNYRLLLGSGIEPAVLELFAHPPLVRAGSYLPPT
jgi:hypothetical protein